uniref:Glycosyltransferase n=1 Tax=Punica granatum TaxID=22663 RepID=A0A193AUW6_PUNGR|nr:UGT73AL1 [Punica granatum]
MANEGETNDTKSTTSKLHIFFFPFPSKGHTIPMIDMAKLFSSRGVKSTLISTPHNEPSFLRSIERTQKLGFDIGVVTVKLPLEKVGLPEHCQILDSTNSPDMINKYWMAIRMLDKQLEKLIKEHCPACVITDTFLPWTVDVAAKFGIPRLAFHGTSHFAMCALECTRLYKPHLNISSDSEPFVIPNFPGEITMTRAQLPDFIKEDTEFSKLYIEMMESELRSYGVIMNSFKELEPVYTDHYRDVLGRRSWRVGPVLLCNQDTEDKLQRGTRATIGEDSCLKWLDSREAGSVVYICFGSRTDFSASQLHEIAEGLEASRQPFVWVVKKDESVEEGKEEWLPQGYEERMQGKGLIIRGWAPQVLILHHKAVSGFVTHCGWNSTLEGITAGVRMVTWPVAAEQFCNEKLITEVLRIGVPVGAKQWMVKVGDSVESEKVEKAVKRIMIGDEAEEMRVRAIELSKIAKKAVEEGGSSHSDLTALLES